MSISYAATGRDSPEGTHGNRHITAARELLAEGITPTVEQAFEDALAPLRPAWGARQHRRLALAVAAASIASFVWLTDMAGLSKRDASELLASTARSLSAAVMAS